MKTKGERLGWKSINELDNIDLKKALSNGREVLPEEFKTKPLLME